MVIPAKAAIQAILGAAIGKLYDPPEMDLIAHTILTNLVRCSKEDLFLFPFGGGKQKQDILRGQFLPFFGGPNLLPVFFTNHEITCIARGAKRIASRAQ
jgi:hypothetical protein